MKCMENSSLKTFSEIYKLRNLMKEPTCFKNPENVTSIDLILTSKPLSFKNTYVRETGLFEFQKMIVAVVKMYFTKTKPQVAIYRKYKVFHNETSLDSLRYELNIQRKVSNKKRLHAFSTICTVIFDKHAPKTAIYAI